jgi:hypothetical protein
MRKGAATYGKDSFGYFYEKMGHYSAFSNKYQ